MIIIKEEINKLNKQELINLLRYINDKIIKINDKELYGFEETDEKVRIERRGKIGISEEIKLQILKDSDTLNVNQLSEKYKLSKTPIYAVLKRKKHEEF
jgi:hypothetical protein